MRTLTCMVKVLIVLAGLSSLSVEAEDLKKGSLSFEDLVRRPQPPAEIMLVACDAYAGAPKTACEQDLKATFDHHRWKMDYTQRAFEAHHIYTMFVFILVCALVVLGMWLSYAEFQEGVRPIVSPSRRGAFKSDTPEANGKPAEPPDGAAGAAPTRDDAKGTQLELSSTGVKLTSPVLGVIILVVSMGFFYLYLKTVYPIEESQPVASSQTSATEPLRSAEPQK